MTSIPNPLPSWQQRYLDDLERYPELLAALNEDDPIYAVARRAKLSELQAWVLREWALGDSLQDIAVGLGKSKTTVQGIVDRALFRALLWLVRTRTAPTTNL